VVPFVLLEQFLFPIPFFPFFVLSSFFAASGLPQPVQLSSLCSTSPPFSPAQDGRDPTAAATQVSPSPFRLLFFGESSPPWFPSFFLDAKYTCLYPILPTRADVFPSSFVEPPRQRSCPFLPLSLSKRGFILRRAGYEARVVPPSTSLTAVYFCEFPLLPKSFDFQHGFEVVLLVFHGDFSSLTFRPSLYDCSFPPPRFWCRRR